MNSIDIVIPCYRYGQYLRECVQSILSQGVPDCRILIIDDESPDETPEVAAALVAEDRRVEYRRHTVNRGHISTYNEGIDWCQAEYMLLISADDYLLPGALPRALRLMEDHPAMGLSFGQAVELGANGSLQDMTIDVDFRGHASLVLTGEDFIRLSIARGARNIVPTPTAIVRTALLKKSGAYHPELPHSADLELWLRLAAHGPVGILKEQQAVYRRHSGNMSLAYMSDHRVSDLKQRQLAFDIFLARCKEILPNAPKLHDGLLRALARDALVEASMTFNANRLTLSNSLCEEAMRFYPGVRRTFRWRRLALKRMIGVQASNALRPLFAKLR